MKKLTFVLFTITTLQCTSQTNEYNASSIYDILYARVHQIENNLYTTSMKGGIRAYRNDSLESFYTPETIIQLGQLAKKVKIKENNFGETDSIYYTQFDPVKDGKGLCAYYNPSYSEFNTAQQTFNLSSVAVLYQPTISALAIELPVQPMFFISYDDFKKVVSTEELKFFNVLSNLLLSDKYPTRYYADQENIKMPKDYFYSTGPYHDMRKFSIMNKESLKSISDNIYNLSTQFILENILKFNGTYYSDAMLKNPYNIDSLRKLMSVPVKLKLYPNPHNPTYSKDSTILSYFDQRAYTHLEINAKSAGLRMEGDKKIYIYMRREDFTRIVPHWLSMFLFNSL